MRLWLDPSIAEVWYVAGTVLCSKTQLLTSPPASFNERLLLGNGLCVSPLKGQSNEPGSRSLRDVAFQIDNARDLNNYVSSFASKVGASGEIKYERHPVGILVSQTSVDQVYS